MIPIKNVYYMLSYAFQILREDGYKKVASEEFENTAELFAAILIHGITLQVKRGLNREYIAVTESLSSPKGKPGLAESVKQNTHLKRKLICTYDEFSVNSRMNRIIKSSVMMLLRAGISKTRRKKLRYLMTYFGNVDETDLRYADWHFRYSRNNQTYRLLIFICHLLYNGLLQTQSDGSVKLKDFRDSREMHDLYEKFLLAYYRKTYPQLSVTASQIPWQLDDDIGAFLPVMQTDITLSDGDRTLIIDAKYYSRMMQSQYEKKTLRSAHLYQIFAYVKNKAASMKGKPHEVSGMLLYAGTDEEFTPNNTYMMSGNRIGVETLDLNQEFSGIEAHLDRIVERHFGIRPY